MLNPVGQARFPARKLGPLIRMEGIGIAPCRTGKRFALAMEVCMTLNEVEQRAGWASRVREAGRRACVEGGMKAVDFQIPKAGVKLRDMGRRVFYWSKPGPYARIDAPAGRL